MFVYREIKVTDLWPILIRTGRTTGMVLFLLAMAMSTAFLLTTAQVPADLVSTVEGISTNPYVILALLCALLLLVGVVMDLTPAMVILAPIMAPIALNVGVPPVYLGVIMSVVLGIGLITPPVGTVLYVGCAVGRVPMPELLRSMPPFYIALLLVVVLLVAFPSLVLWLPTAAL
jgi:tripartite ATP-independent transporter DctM subunit